MEDEKVKDLVTKIFEKISHSKSVADLKNIIDCYCQLQNKFNEVLYEKINFEFNPEEIEFLRNNRSKEGFKINLTNADVQTKLLYSLAWKNGDLKKLEHIVDGITSSENEERDSGFVFYQFGKHLANRIEEPIIDQHVLRSFFVYQKIMNHEEIDKSRKLTLIKKEHLGLINNYKEWLNNLVVSTENDYLYHVDKILFALGKTIKI